MACNRNLTRACHSGPKQIGILKLRVVGMPIEALQPTACRSKSTLINTGQLETTHKECSNPHSTCRCRRRRTPSSLVVKARCTSVIPQHLRKGRAEASHSSVSFNDNKDCRQIILRPRTERPQSIAQTFHQSIDTPLNDTFHLAVYPAVYRALSASAQEPR